MNDLTFNEVIQKIITLFTQPLFSIGKTDFSMTVLLAVILSFILLFYVSAKIGKFVSKIIQAKSKENIGTSRAIGTISRYIVLVIGILVIFQSMGINMSTLNVLFGALGVGIGFGLQNIANNFISGLIILFERPIKVGDRIEAGDVTGDVMDINARATTVNTNDNITIIIPNSEFISQKVINWSHNDRKVRFRIPVGVSYNEDPDKVRDVLLKIARDHTGVIQYPAPMVTFDEFADSSLNFSLLVWTSDYINRPRIFKSELYFEIFRQFKKYQIEIPFPQRDLHLRSGFDKIIESQN